MNKEFSKYLSKSIFVDTNAFIYLLTGMCNRLTREIFRLGSQKRVKLITSTRVIDELLFKVMIIEARKEYNLGTNIPFKLRNDRDKVKKLADSCRIVFDLLKDFSIRVIEIKMSHLQAIPEIMGTYGLFGNDAITVKIMKSLNLKYILTADRDFEVLESEGVEIICPV